MTDLYDISMLVGTSAVLTSSNPSNAHISVMSCAQLEARLREAVRDGNALARETGELKAALKRAQAQSGLPRRNGLTNGRSAGDKVSQIFFVKITMRGPIRQTNFPRVERCVLIELWLSVRYQ